MKRSTFIGSVNKLMTNFSQYQSQHYFFFFFFSVELARQIYVLVCSSFCKMTRLAKIFLKVGFFFENHTFPRKITISTLHIPTKKNFSAISFSKRKLVFIPEMLVNLEPTRRGETGKAS